MFHVLEVVFDFLIASLLRWTAAAAVVAALLLSFVTWSWIPWSSFRGLGAALAFVLGYVVFLLAFEAVERWLDRRLP